MKKRLFIAIKLNKTTLDALQSLQKKLKQALPYQGIRWVDPELFHLTLQFLGDTEMSQVPTLVANLESAAAKAESFELSIEGVGFFGSRNAVRTIWAGTKPSIQFRRLFEEVIHSTDFLQIEQPPRFSPHLTLARGSDWLGREESMTITDIIAGQKSTAFGVTRVSSFELIESTLYPTGPVYKTFKKFHLV